MRIDLRHDDDPATALAGGDGSIVAVVPAPDSPTGLALLRATLAHAAAGSAPGGRVNAVAVSPGAAPAAVASAVAYLEGATATTGQLLEIGQAARLRPQGPSADSTTR